MIIYESLESLGKNYLDTNRIDQFTLKNKAAILHSTTFLTLLTMPVWKNWYKLEMTQRPKEACNLSRTQKGITQDDFI